MSPTPASGLVGTYRGNAKMRMKQRGRVKGFTELVRVVEGLWAPEGTEGHSVWQQGAGWAGMSWGWEGALL